MQIVGHLQDARFSLRGVRNLEKGIQGDARLEGQPLSLFSRAEDCMLMAVEVWFDTIAERLSAKAAELPDSAEPKD